MLTVRVTVEDDSGVLFEGEAGIPRDQIYASGSSTPGLKCVADALLNACKSNEKT